MGVAWVQEALRQKAVALLRSLTEWGERKRRLRNCCRDLAVEEIEESAKGGAGFVLPD